MTTRSESADPCVELERDAAALKDEIDNDEELLNASDTPPAQKRQLEQDLKQLRPQFARAVAKVEACQQAQSRASRWMDVPWRLAAGMSA